MQNHTAFAGMRHGCQGTTSIPALLKFLPSAPAFQRRQSDLSVHVASLCIVASETSDSDQVLMCQPGLMPVVLLGQVEQANYAHLCTVMSSMHHRRTGYPFGTLVDFACDGAGQPIFCLSPLAIHTRNILADPRCSMVVQMPGWSGLANARVTIFGDVYQLPPEMQGTAREVNAHVLLRVMSARHLKIWPPPEHCMLALLAMAGPSINPCPS